MKVALNRATINALVDAFGRSSKDWQGHPLTLEVDKLPGKKSPLCLIPIGYKRIEDENGYSVIVKNWRRHGNSAALTIKGSPPE